MRPMKAQVLIGCCFRHPKQAGFVLIFSALTLFTVVMDFKSASSRIRQAVGLGGPRLDTSRVMSMTAGSPFFSHTRLIPAVGFRVSERAPESLSLKRRGGMNVTPVTVSNTLEKKSKTPSSLQPFTTPPSSASLVITVSDSDHEGDSYIGHLEADKIHSSTRTTTESSTLPTNSTPSNFRTSKPRTSRQLSNTTAGQSSQTQGDPPSVASTPFSHNVCGQYQFHTDDAELQLFRPAVKNNDFCLLRDTLKTLSQALIAANITFFLYGGTLLGSWRHHGLVPWDDDVDIAVDSRFQHSLWRVLSELYPSYLFWPRPLTSWKFFSPAGHPISNLTWKWPFIDICFFDENDTHVTEHDLNLFPEFVFPREWVFPLRLRPFQGLSLPAPWDTRQVLERTYNLSECTIGHYSHRTEMGRVNSQLAKLPCHRLRAVYPHVRHVPLAKQACQESLLLNGTVLRQVVFNAPC